MADGPAMEVALVVVTPVATGDVVLVAASIIL